MNLTFKGTHFTHFFFYIKLDVDHDGCISWPEFLAFQVKSRQALEATWPMDIKSIRNEFSNLDMDGSGSISRSEFLDVFSRLHGSR
jgi:hypothetical protein